MNAPFRFRSIPLYAFDGDGQFDDVRIVGPDKRRFRKRQLRRMHKDFLGHEEDSNPRDWGSRDSRGSTGMPDQFAVH